MPYLDCSSLFCEGTTLVKHDYFSLCVISLVQRFSSWLKLLKFIALCLRCQRRLITRRGKSTQGGFDKSSQIASLDSLTCSEINDAETEVIMFDHSRAFAEDRRAIEIGHCVKKSSVLAKLDPILVNGLLRVGGRLSRAPLHDDGKHQTIIAKDSPLARLLIQHFHQKSGQSDREYVLSLLRERFWLTRANFTVPSVFASCFGRRRRQGAVGEQKMADLPRPRVTPNQLPFTCVGIDYFGPFFVRQKRSMVKRYGAIFTCLAVRAVHLAISYTLDTASFILTLRRFIAGRGQVKEIHSDNGTSFTGAEKELRVMIEGWNQAKIHEELLQKGIQWYFNPPAARIMAALGKE